MRRAVAAAAILLVACLPERERPGPMGPGQTPALEAELLSPPSGATVMTELDVSVTVHARDASQSSLEGVGFVARRGSVAVDSAVVRFAPRSDTVHVFVFDVPDTLATNTQLDVYGIAFGPDGMAVLSAPAHLTVVHCENGVCQ